jgi:diguanylate cyclase (GGDEF)-like protein
MADTGERENLNEYVDLSSFADSGIAITASKTINEAIHQVMDKIGKIFNPTHWFLLLKDHNNHEIYIKYAYGDNADQLKGEKVSDEDGVINWILENKKGVFIEDVEIDSRYDKHYDVFNPFSPKTIMGALLKINDNIVGIIELINKTDNTTYTRDELDILTTISNYTAVSIEKVYYLSALRNLTVSDALTGVHNRRNFDIQLLKEIERCKRYNQEICLLIITLPYFNNLIKRYGIEAGDKVLKDLADILKQNTRKVDYVGRYSSHIFSVLMPHTNRENAEIVWLRIQKDIKKRNQDSSLPEIEFNMNIYNADPNNIDDVIREFQEYLIRN